MSNRQIRKSKRRDCVVEKNRESVASPAIPTGPERHAIEALSNARDDFEQAFGQDHYYTRLVGDLLTKVAEEEKRGRPTIKQNEYLKRMIESMMPMKESALKMSVRTTGELGTAPTPDRFANAALSYYAGQQAATSAALLGYAHGRQGRSTFVPHVVTRFNSPNPPDDPATDDDLLGEAPWPSDDAWLDWEDHVRTPQFSEPPVVLNALDTLHRSK